MYTFVICVLARACVYLCVFVCMYNLGCTDEALKTTNTTMLVSTAKCVCSVCVCVCV